MKRLLLTLAFVSITTISNAQKVKFGAKLGTNFSTIKATKPIINGEVAAVVQDNYMLFGFHVGGFAEIGLLDKFFFQPELLISSQGSKFESSQTEIFGSSSNTYSIDQKLNTIYINVPLLVKYYATEKFFINAGSQIGFLLSAKQNYTQIQTYTFSGSTTIDTTYAEDIDLKDSFKSIDFSLVAGAGYFFTENIFAEVRYTIGLSNFIKKVSYNDAFISYEYEQIAKNNVLQVSVGYRF